MAYQNPNDIDSPKGRWKLDAVLCDTGDGGWSVAEGVWDESYALGVRWNGSDWNKTSGNPQSRGKPTWFILPYELHEAVKAKALQLNESLDMLTCIIKKPEDFGEGAFSVTIKLCNTAWEKLKNREIVFSPPSIKHWLWVPIADQDTGNDYNAVILERGELRRAGKIINGEWKSLLYSSGISLQDNPVSLGQVEKTLIESVKTAISQTL